MMKTRIVPEGEDAVFHVISRMAFQMLNMGDEEKRVFRDLLEKQALFSGVEVLSYCLLDNHFHLLVRVPFQPTISDPELLKRYSALYELGDPRYVMSPSDLADILKKGGKPAQEARQRLLARMGSISIFMKELKQRFTLWYNRKHENSGTLWAKRFDSVLVENVKKTLQLIGAYIDSNPVRLKLCKSPKDYAFCTFGEAAKGNPTARSWLARTLDAKQWSRSLQKYERLLAENKETLNATMRCFRGMKSGVIGTDEFVNRWSHYGGGHTKRKTKRSVPSLILEGILYAGACALSAPRGGLRPPAMP